MQTRQITSEKYPTYVPTNDLTFADGRTKRRNRRQKNRIYQAYK